MDNNNIKLNENIYIQLISLINYGLFDHELPDDFIISNIEELYSVSQQHDVSHIVGYALKKYNYSICDNTYEDFQKQYYLSLLRVTSLDSETRRIASVLEEEAIDFIVLKGESLRRIYPESWMRVSSDIDILVREESIKTAISVLKNKLGYKFKIKSSHDYSFISPKDIHLELHFILSAKECRSQSILQNVWSYCRKERNSMHEYVLNDDFKYFYHMYHAAKHFQLGGCGIRAVIDTWMLNNRINSNKSLRNALLEESGLITFSKTIEEISENWFTYYKVDYSNIVERYILFGGVYGAEQGLMAKQAKSGDNKRYVLYRLFPPLNRIKMTYPFLNKYPFLLPFCWLHRLVKSIFSGKSDKARVEFKRAKNCEEESILTAKMFKDLELE